MFPPNLAIEPSDPDDDAPEMAADDEAVCQYTAAHTMAGVAATRVIDCGRVGFVPACEPCAAFYQRMKGGRK